MNKIVKNTLAKIRENPTLDGLDSIKAVLKQECDSTGFTITEADWDVIMTDILYELSSK